jgi:hypothetical protein
VGERAVGRGSCGGKRKRRVGGGGTELEAGGESSVEKDLIEVSGEEHKQ